MSLPENWVYGHFDLNQDTAPTPQTLVASALQSNSVAER